MRFLLIATLFIACKPASKDNDIQIQQLTVKKGHSYKIDLEKATYTVYFMNGRSSDYKFTLSDQEKRDISKMAQVCGLTKLTGKVEIEDKCDMFPKVMTELSFSVGKNHVQVSIDAGCDEHPLFKQGKAEDIIKFLKFLQDKIAAKPEVAKAPQSDVRYM